MSGQPHEWIGRNHPGLTGTHQVAKAIFNVTGEYLVFAMPLLVLERASVEVRLRG
jgi:hypothetical protein